MLIITKSYSDTLINCSLASFSISGIPLNVNRCEIFTFNPSSYVVWFQVLKVCCAGGTFTPRDNRILYSRYLENK